MALRREYEEKSFPSILMKSTKTEIFQGVEQSLDVFVFVHTTLILLLSRRICRFWEGNLCWSDWQVRLFMGLVGWFWNWLGVYRVIEAIVSKPLK